jgi:hypothetical protein
VRLFLWQRAAEWMRKIAWIASLEKPQIKKAQN